MDIGAHPAEIHLADVAFQWAVHFNLTEVLGAVFLIVFLASLIINKKPR